MSQTKDCTGPFGFKMRESAARIAEAAIKQQPREVRDLYKTKVTAADGSEITVEGYARRPFVPEGMDFKEVKSSKGVERSDVAIITTDCVDRDGEVVMANGLDFSAWQKNPLVAWAHKYDCYGVGMGQWVAKTKVGDSAGWKAKTVYAPRPPELAEDQEWFADTCWWLGNTGYLRGRSIGFIPLSVRPASAADARERAEWAKAKRFIDAASVIEYSVCALPCNAEALIEDVPRAKAAGFIIGKSMLDALGIVIPEPVSSVAKAEEPPIVINSPDAKSADAHKRFPTFEEASDYLNQEHKGHGRILGPDGATLRQCRCSGEGHETVVCDSAPKKEFTAESTGSGGGFVAPPNPPQPPMPKKSKMSHVSAVLPGHVHAAAKAMAKSIDKKHLADGDQPDEFHPHVKLLDSDDAGEVQEAVKGYGTVIAHVGKVYSVHSPAAGDVPAHDQVRVKLHSYDLKGLHEKLALLPHNEKIEGGYEPHLHLANVKAGMGEASAKELGDSMPMEGMQLSMKSLRMKDHDGGLHDIHLDSMGKSFKSVLPGAWTKSGDDRIVCPRCLQADFVQPVGDGDGDDDDDDHEYFCMFCGSEFDEDDKPEEGHQPDGTEKEKEDATKIQKAEGGMKVNTACEKKAMADAKAGKVSDAPWSAPVGSKRKAEYCLAEDTSAKEGSAGRLKYPVFDSNGTLNRKAVANAESRASKNAPNVAACAKKIMEAIQAHDEDKKKTDKAMTDEAVIKAVESNLRAREPEIAKAVADRAIDLIMGKLGKV